MRVASFDIFDTVLTRKVGKPSSLFYLLAESITKKGIINVTLIKFVRSRIKAEEIARSKHKNGEVKIEDIYNELSFLLDLLPNQLDEIINEEFRIEDDNILLVPGSDVIIKQARDNKYQIVYISNMYLPSSFIKNALKKHGLWKNGDKIYVSSEYNAQKNNGELFRILLKNEGLNSSDIIHTGNDIQSDIKGAASSKIKTRIYKECDLNRYENLMESYTDETSGLSSLFAGASRYTRLSVPAVSTQEKAIRDVACGVAAPVLTGFVLWILKQCIKRDIKRLYFVSRDGEILSKIALLLNSKLKLNIDIRYIYGSRQAWHISTIDNYIDISKLSWVIENADYLSIHTILCRLGCSPDNVSSILNKYGWTESKWNINLSPDDLKSFIRVLQDVEFKKYILSQMTTKKELLKSYLKQIGIYDEMSKAVVDIGWKGRMLNSLSLNINDNSIDKPHYLLFGLSADSPLNNEQASSYLFDLRSNVGNKIFSGLPMVLEMFCSASHGRTIGYTINNDIIEPIFDESHSIYLNKWGLDILQNSILSFVNCLNINNISTYIDTKELSYDLLKLFWINPLYCEALAWSSFRFEDEQSGGNAINIAQPMNWKDFANYINRRIYWYSGSLSITPPLHILYFRIRRKIRNIIIPNNHIDKVIN